MNWDIDVSIYGNSNIFKQIAFCFGLACGIMGVFLALITWDIMLLYIFGCVSIGLMVVGWIATLIFYGGKNKLSFSMDSNGVVSETRKEQVEKSRIINIMLIIIGVFSRKPTYAGMGVLGEARGHAESVKWEKVKQVKYKPESQTIILSSGVFQKLMIFCTEENYAEAAEFVKVRTQG